MNKNIRSIGYALYALLSVLLSARIADAAQEGVSASRAMSDEMLREIVKTKEQFLAFVQLEVIDKEDIHRLLLSGIKAGFLNGVKYLVEKKGADIHRRDQHGNTVIHCAAGCEQLPILDYFNRRHPIMLTTINIFGETPFLLAVRHGKLQSMKYLLTTGRIDLSAENSRKQKALHVACSFGHLDIVKHLIEICARSPEILSGAGISPLHWAAFGNQLPVVEYLVSKGAKSTTIDSQGRTPLTYAVRGGCLPIVKFLVQRTPYTRPTNSGFSILHFAAQSGNIHVIDYLIKQCKVSVDSIAHDLSTPLSLAARRGDCAVVEYLIDNGAKIDGLRHHGIQQTHNPLMAALEARQTNIAVLLIRKGALLLRWHLYKAESTGQLNQILRGVTDLVAAGKIDNQVLLSYVCAKMARDLRGVGSGADQENAWVNTDDGKACALFAQVLPICRALEKQGQAEVNKVQEIERILRRCVPRDVAQLILSDFLPIPRLLLNRGQEKASVDVDRLESSDSVVGRKRQDIDVDSEESEDFVSDDVEDTDSTRTEQSWQADYDVDDTAPPVKRQRRG